MPWLDYGGRLRKLPDGPVIIGSGSDAAVRIDDLDLAPRHVVVEPTAGSLSVRAYSPDVVVAHGRKQVGSDACDVPYGDPILAGSGELRVWRDQPAHPATAPTQPPRGYLVSLEEQAAYPLDRLCTNIGRASANAIRLTDPTASRFHAQIRREAGGFALHVVGSAGGSINGRRVASPQLLDEGDAIELAYARFTFTGALPPEVRVVATPAPGEEARTERPTIARDRVSLQHPVQGRPPKILPTAIVIGGLLLIGALGWLLLGA